MFLKRIGIDLGTTNVLVHCPKGVINEPSVVAISNVDKKSLPWAPRPKKCWVGLDTIIARRPLKDG
jgi:actin-like ATPase involved in cell morphogenesis